MPPLPPILQSAKTSDSNQISCPPSPYQEATELQRRACGCVKTSDKLRNLLKLFPQAPPPTPCNHVVNHMGVIEPDVSEKTCTQTMYHPQCPKYYKMTELKQDKFYEEEDIKKVEPENCLHKGWVAIRELISLIQLSVTATALAIYYLIYCYMQLIYFTLRSAMYFHHADAFMKITISIVTVTTLLIAFQFLTRIEKLIYRL